MDRLEGEGLLVKHRLLARTCELPGRYVAEALVVTLRLALRRLILFAEVTAARLLALQGVVTHQLGELEEVGHAAGVLERLVELFTLAAHVNILPELVAQHADPSHRLLQPRSVPRHPAFVPHQSTELAMEGVDRLPTARPKEATDPLVHLTLDLAERRMLNVDLGGFRLAEVVADRVRQDEVAVGEPLHQRARAQPVGS